MARWLDGLDIAGGEHESDGSVRIDEDHNGPLLDAFEANVECSLELYRDADGDGSKSKGDDLLATLREGLRCSPSWTWSWTWPCTISYPITKRVSTGATLTLATV